jgi:integrase
MLDNIERRISLLWNKVPRPKKGQQGRRDKPQIPQCAAERAVAMLKNWGPEEGGLVFHRASGKPLDESKIDKQHSRLRRLLKLPEDFVLYSLRHSFGTRLGESGADAFTIMRLMGHLLLRFRNDMFTPLPKPSSWRTKG